MRTLPSSLRAALLGVTGWVLAGAISPSPAHADDVADAKDLFARGRELRGHGQCAEAIPLFRKAFGLYPAGLGSIRNIAECEESLGHFASARRAWLDLKRELITHTDSKYEGWSQDAEEAAARLRPKLARVTIEVDGAAGLALPGDAVSVTMNGEPLPANLVGTVLDRDPGHYVVRATSPRAAAFDERALDLAAGDEQRLVLHLAITAPGVEQPTAAGTAGLISAPTRRALGWVALGLGGASLVGAGVSALVFKGASDEVEQQCPNNHCLASSEPSVQPIADRGRTAATLVNVLLPAGAVLAAGGIALVLTSRTERTQAALVLTPSGAFVRGELW
ncbi:MAG: tetratricopeptide repeat protein [Myxococcales bacterium]|nr:tetratricopeptide repeat protein [Myxococcales bacterium]